MQTYMLITFFTGLSSVFFIDMIYVILDRLLSIWLNLKYPIYCTQSTTKCLLYLTLTIGIVMSISVSIAHRYFGYDWETAFFTYFYPTFEFTIIIATLITYIFIFTKYKGS